MAIIALGVGFFAGIKATVPSMYNLAENYYKEQNLMNYRLVSTVGFDKEDIQLDLKDGFLTIKAQHKEDQDQKDAQGSYIRRERRLGTFARAFDISGIDEAGITASYTNGILSLTLPKQAPVVPAARQIAMH